VTTPKIELHVHLEGAIRPAALLDIARRNGQPLPADNVDDLARLYEFTDFDHFIEVWLLTTNCLRGADDFRRVAVDYAAEAASFGAVYVEGIFSPCERVARGVPWEDIFEGYVDGAAEAAESHGVTMRFTPDLYRGVDPELAEECARVAVRYRDRGVVGLGLGGSEHASTAALYRKAIDIARDGGLGFVPHAGELPQAGIGPEATGGAAAVREVLAFEPARIRHGIHAAEDPGLLNELVERGIVLDVCPTSNVRTHAVADLASHPLPSLRAAGVPCTVNTDDPAMFGTDLGREYEVAEKLGVSAADAYAAGVAGALCDDDTRARLITLTTPGPDPRSA
jgi:aminodeoxyfutalosine deaminase